MIPLKPFYFMRHGQTDYNKENKCMGSLDIPLNAHGEQQAYDALELFQGLAIDHIISSPLQRAYKTAKIIADHHMLSLDTTALLVEASWGAMEGQSKTDATLFTQWREGLVFNGGESFENVKARVKEALHHHLSGETLTPLFVSHGGVYWAILELLELPYSDATNCQIVYFSPVGNASNKWVCAVL